MVIKITKMLSKDYAIVTVERTHRVDMFQTRHVVQILHINLNTYEYVRLVNS